MKLILFISLFISSLAFAGDLEQVEKILERARNSSCLTVYRTLQNVEVERDPSYTVGRYYFIYGYSPSRKKNMVIEAFSRDTGVIAGPGGQQVGYADCKYYSEKAKAPTAECDGMLYVNSTPPKGVSCTPAGARSYCCEGDRQGTYENGTYYYSVPGKP